MMFYTYILYSRKLGKYYTGSTSDLDNRFNQHNRGKTPFTAKGIPWDLIYSKELTCRSDAMILEKKIKKRGAARFLIDMQKT